MAQSTFRSRAKKALRGPGGRPANWRSQSSVPVNDDGGNAQPAPQTGPGLAGQPQQSEMPIASIHAPTWGDRIRGIEGRVESIADRTKGGDLLMSPLVGLSKIASGLTEAGSGISGAKNPDLVDANDLRTGPDRSQVPGPGLRSVISGAADVMRLPGQFLTAAEAALDESPAMLEAAPQPGVTEQIPELSFRGTGLNQPRSVPGSTFTDEAVDKAYAAHTPYTLGPAETDASGNTFRHPIIHTGTGGQHGELITSHLPNGEVKVEWLGGDYEGGDLTNRLGMRTLRQLRSQYLNAHPELSPEVPVSSLRVGGGRVNRAISKGQSVVGRPWNFKANAFDEGGQVGSEEIAAAGDSMSKKEIKTNFRSRAKKNAPVLDEGNGGGFLSSVGSALEGAGKNFLGIPKGQSIGEGLEKNLTGENRAPQGSGARPNPAGDQVKAAQQGAGQAASQIGAQYANDSMPTMNAPMPGGVMKLPGQSSVMDDGGPAGPREMMNAAAGNGKPKVLGGDKDIRVMTKKSINVNDGTHFPAILQSGERVLTPEQNAEWMKEQHGFPRSNNQPETVVMDEGGDKPASHSVDSTTNQSITNALSPAFRMAKPAQDTVPVHDDGGMPSVGDQPNPNSYGSRVLRNLSMLLPGKHAPAPSAMPKVESVNDLGSHDHLGVSKEQLIPTYRKAREASSKLALRGIEEADPLLIGTAALGHNLLDRASTTMFSTGPRPYRDRIASVFDEGTPGATLSAPDQMPTTDQAPLPSPGEQTLVQLGRQSGMPAEHPTQQPRLVAQNAPPALPGQQHQADDRTNASASSPVPSLLSNAPGSTAKGLRLPGEPGAQPATSTTDQMPMPGQSTTVHSAADLKTLEQQARDMMNSPDQLTAARGQELLTRLKGNNPLGSQYNHPGALGKIAHGLQFFAPTNFQLDAPGSAANLRLRHEGALQDISDIGKAQADTARAQHELQPANAFELWHTQNPNAPVSEFMALENQNKERPIDTVAVSAWLQDHKQIPVDPNDPSKGMRPATEFDAVVALKEAEAQAATAGKGMKPMTGDDAIFLVGGREYRQYFDASTGKSELRDVITGEPLTQYPAAPATPAATKSGKTPPPPPTPKLPPLSEMTLPGQGRSPSGFPTLGELSSISAPGSVGMTGLFPQTKSAMPTIPPAIQSRGQIKETQKEAAAQRAQATQERQDQSLANTKETLGDKPVIVTTKSGKQYLMSRSLADQYKQQYGNTGMITDIVEANDKEVEDAHSKLASATAFTNLLDRYRQSFTTYDQAHHGVLSWLQQFADETGMAYITSTIKDDVAQSVIEGAFEGIPAVGTVAKIVTSTLNTIAKNAAYGTLSPEAKQMVADYVNVLVENFANMKEIAGSVGRNEKQIMVEMNAIPAPTLDTKSANTMLDTKTSDLQDRYRGLFHIQGQPFPYEGQQQKPAGTFDPTKFPKAQ